MENRQGEDNVINIVNNLKRERGRDRWRVKFFDVIGSDRKEQCLVYEIIISKLVEHCWRDFSRDGKARLWQQTILIS